MYVSRIRAAGIYGSRSYDVSLAPVSLLVGGNGTGKTTLLGLIELGIRGADGEVYPLLGKAPRYPWRVELDLVEDDAVIHVRREYSPEGEQLVFTRVTEERSWKLEGDEAQHRLVSLALGADEHLVEALERSDAREWFRRIASARGDVEDVPELWREWEELEHSERMKQIDRLKTPSAFVLLIDLLHEARRPLVDEIALLRRAVEQDQQREAELLGETEPGTVAHWRARCAELDQRLEEVAEQLGQARASRARHEELVKRIETLTERLDLVEEEHRDKIAVVRENKRVLDEQTHQLLTMLAGIEEQIAASRAKASSNVRMQKTEPHCKMRHGLQTQEEAIWRRVQRLEIERAAILPDLHDLRQRARAQHETEVRLQHEHSFMRRELQEQLNDARRALAETESGAVEGLETLRATLREERAEAQKRADHLSDEAALRSDWDHRQARLTEAERRLQELDHAGTYARSHLIRRMKRATNSMEAAFALSVGQAMGGAVRVVLDPHRALHVLVERDGATLPARGSSRGKLAALGVALLVLEQRRQHPWRPLLVEGLGELDDATLGRLIRGITRARLEGMLTQWIGTTTRAQLGPDDVPDLNPDDPDAEVRIIRVEAERTI